MSAPRLQAFVDDSVRIASGAWHLRAIMSLVALAMTGGASAQPDQIPSDFDWGFTRHKKGNFLYASSRMPVPVTLAVTCPGEAGKGDVFSVLEVPARRRAKVPIAAPSPSKEKCVGQGLLGLLHPTGFNDVFRLPFAVERGICVGQAPPSMRSHTGRERFAIDFLTNTGEPVVAARAGVVAKTEWRMTKGGLDPSLPANFIQVIHDDGTMAMYAHLEHNGVNVRPGQRVKEGEVIGRSGATGYAAGPHLHFAAGRPDVVFNAATKRQALVIQTIAVRFQFGAGAFDVREGDFLQRSRQEPLREPASNSCRDPRSAIQMRAGQNW